MNQRFTNMDVATLGLGAERPSDAKTTVPRRPSSGVRPAYASGRGGPLRSLAPLRSVLLLFVAPSLTFASAADIYLADSARGTVDGSSCANARAWTYFNSAGNWGSGSTQIGPGTTVHLCGTITASAGGGGLVAGDYRAV